MVVSASSTNPFEIGGPCLWNRISNHGATSLPSSFFFSWSVINAAPPIVLNSGNNTGRPRFFPPLQPVSMINGENVTRVTPFYIYSTITMLICSFAWETLLLHPVNGYKLNRGGAVIYVGCIAAKNDSGELLMVSSMVCLKSFYLECVGTLLIFPRFGSNANKTHIRSGRRPE